MLLKPEKARAMLRKAGSTNFINYSEITVRLFPAIALIMYADFSKTILLFKLLGWMMLLTSLVLYFVPRRIHYSFSQKAADILTPKYFQLISPFAILFGSILIYSVV